jgi:hypothetical protein
MTRGAAGASGWDATRRPSDRRGTLTRRTADDGHLVGNHTLSHVALAEHADQVATQVLGGDQAIRSVSGRTTRGSSTFARTAMLGIGTTMTYPRPNPWRKESLPRRPRRIQSLCSCTAGRARLQMRCACSSSTSSDRMRCSSQSPTSQPTSALHYLRLDHDPEHRLGAIHQVGSVVPRAGRRTRGVQRPRPSPRLQDRQASWRASRGRHGEVTQ